MIKALLDTNVVLDALASRKPFCEQAEKIFMLVAEEKIQGFITANSLTDIYYLIRKGVTEATARDTLRNLLQLFSVVGITENDCVAALDLLITDYEDALLVVCAEKAAIDCIITRDEDFLQSAPSAISPAVFLEDNINRE
ncbi:PIN domain-containing protein [Desulfovibrio sp. OttesenSCG-928-F20]|nr:PIN domain-containing protein [Desulfovibrio sp. OttesenSCG-928-F20]